MIKINLLGDVKTVDHSQTLFIAGYIASLALLLLVSFLMHSSVSARVEDLKAENELLNTQLNNLKEKTKSVADLEKKKLDLADKLKIIALLKRSKSGPVRVLDDLNSAVPERSWVVSLRESENTLRITGIAMDNQTIATFMKDLATSDYYEAVDLVETKISDLKGVKLRAYSLDAKINYAGRVKPTPVPAFAAVAPVVSATGATSAAAPPAATAAVAPASSPSAAAPASDAAKTDKQKLLEETLE